MTDPVERTRRSYEQIADDYEIQAASPQPSAPFHTVRAVWKAEKAPQTARRPPPVNRERASVVL